MSSKKQNPKQVLSKTAAPSGKKAIGKKTEYDFSNIIHSDISELKMDDPDLLEELGLQPFPEFEEPNELNHKELYKKYKEFFTRCLIKSSIIDHQRNMVLNKMKDLAQIENDLMESEDDEMDEMKAKSNKVGGDNDEETDELDDKKGKSKKGKKAVEKESDNEQPMVNKKSKDKKGKVVKQESEDEEEEEEEKPKKGKPKVPKKSAEENSEEEMESNESEEPDEEDEEEPPKKGKPAPKSVQKKARK